jgi:transcriptional regulator with XRE-family HTH domain
MGNALANVGWESCLIDPRRDRALETYALRKTGVPIPTVRYFIPVPWLARAIVDLHPESGLLMHLDLRNYISGIERGKRNVALRNIEAIAKALDLTISELLRGL